MPEYINHNGYTVHLAGPDGQVVKIRSRQKMVLPDFFDRYRVRGFIKLANDVVDNPTNIKRIQAKIILQKKSQIPPKDLSNNIPITNNPSQVAQSSIEERRARRKEANAVQRAIRRSKIIASEEAARKSVITKSVNNRPKVRTVGRELKQNPNIILKQNLESFNYPISNGVGVGVLSYNRKASLKRCVDSILAFTDLTRSTVFISDDCSDDNELRAYLEELSSNNNIVILRNEKRLGIAGNTNRLLRCLSRFNYGIVLNDDVQVLKQGWDTFYPSVMATIGFHHLIYHQEGIYGAKPGSIEAHNGSSLSVIQDKPQGAILAFNNHMLKKCGYFDEGYGLYGMEHVDWSMKAWEFTLQPKGFYDAVGSSEYFYLNHDQSAVNNRSQLLKEAKSRFDRRVSRYVAPSDDSQVPAISYIIPFRNVERTNAIKTVVNNIRAQKYPVIDIHLTEQDSTTKINLIDYGPVNYHLVSTNKNDLFNKSMAFNYAAARCVTKNVVMHDADILAPNFYTKTISDLLVDHDGCHIGSTVIYADEVSSARVNSTNIIDLTTNCERMVGYYEGGSLACSLGAYWRCGGFNEDFWGYGCEDCDFYARLAAVSTWYEKRSIDFLHLHHGRVPNWNAHHNKNKDIDNHLKSLTMADRVRIQYKQLKENGYGEFVDKALN